MKIKDISQWRTCSLAERKTQLPNRSGLYAVLNRGRIYYIGKSKNLNKRWSSGHHRYPQAAKLSNPLLAWIPLREDLITQAERQFIGAYDTPWNNTAIPESGNTQTIGWVRFLQICGLAAALGTALGLYSLRVFPIIQPQNNNLIIQQDTI